MSASGLYLVKASLMGPQICKSFLYFNMIHFLIAFKTFLFAVYFVHLYTVIGFWITPFLGGGRLADARDS